MAVRLTQVDLDTTAGDIQQWAYNSMDSAVTAELFETMSKQLDRETLWIYSFERACLAPAMEMALRGIKVDLLEKSRMISKLQDDSRRLDAILSIYGEALGVGRINANSLKQLKHIFYELLSLPEQKVYDKGKKEERTSLNRASLEKLAKYPIANPLVKAILAQRDCVKKLSVLHAGVDPDGCMRFSFNVGGTETGRWSSSKNVFRGGMNAQNITEELRRIFIARPGFKLAYIDLEQAESRAVAVLSKDAAYAQACNSGDLHTTVCRLIWPKRDWNGDLAHDRKLADQPFYRQFSFRDMAKRGGHGTNYYGLPRTMAIHLKVEVAIMEDFQRNYFRAFPGIRAWHEAVAFQLQTTGRITTPFGRRRNFLGRLGDNSTLREAIAYGPQSLIADYINYNILSLWQWNKVRLLAQVHDAIFFEYPEDRDDLVYEAGRLISQPLKLADGSTFQIPVESAVGWNWAKASETNPHGLKKLKPQTPDTRTPPSNGSAFAILDKRLS